MNGGVRGHPLFPLWQVRATEFQPKEKFVDGRGGWSQ
jgi:hypothetical protein